MKISMQQISSGEDEVVIKYRQLTPKIQRLAETLRKDRSQRIMGKREGEQYRLEPEEIYYFESVEEKLFAYTEEREYQVMMTLAEAAKRWRAEGFFRCNKSFAVNINKISSVKSEMGNRIDAVLWCLLPMLLVIGFGMFFHWFLKDAAWVSPVFYVIMGLYFLMVWFFLEIFYREDTEEMNRLLQGRQERKKKREEA